MSDADRRVDPRFPIRLRVTFSDGGELGEHMLDNMSEGGLFIRTPKQIPIGTELEIAIHIGADPPIRQRGRVTWARGFGGEEGVGVRFVGTIDSRLASLLPPHRPHRKPGDRSAK